MCSATGFATRSILAPSSGAQTSTLSRLCGSSGEWLAGVRPGERLGGRVVALEEAEQLCLEVVFAGEGAALQEPAGEDREEELDLVEPGGVRRGEVKPPARVLGEPVAHLGRLVHLQVVEDRVHLVA